MKRRSHVTIPSESTGTKALAVFSLILLATGAAQAQTFLASISGIASDPSGAVVPGVKVTATDTLRGVSFSTQSNQTGAYLLKDLIPSTYRISAETVGFSTFVVDSFPLSANQSAVLNITLKIGSASQKVEVTSQVQMVEPSNATLGGLVNNQAIVDLPLSNRNALSLMALEPGVAPSTPNSYQSFAATSAPRFSFNGGLESTSPYQLDGISIESQSDLPGIYALAVLPSVDSIQEIRVQTQSYSATYGRSGGGITTIVTKSGTNAFHGGGFEFLRNDVLNADGFFTNRSGAKKSMLRGDQYGGDIGGPIRKNRTFFFASYDKTLSHAGAFSLFTVPTAAERTGDFSQDLNSAGQLKVLYNPFSTRPDPNNPGQYIRDAIPGNNLNNVTGNTIDGHTLDPVAVKSTTYIPLPNLPGVKYTGANNLGLSAVASNPTNLLTAKVDHNFSGTQRGFVRYNLEQSVSGADNYYGNMANSNCCGPFKNTGHNAVLGYTQSFGATTVLDARVAFNRYQGIRYPLSYGFNMTSLGLPASLEAYTLAGNAGAVFPVLPSRATRERALPEAICTCPTTRTGKPRPASRGSWAGTR